VGLLIDRRTAEKFANMTASAIATQLAGRVGLTPVVTATTTKVGTYYTIDHALLTREVSEWDLLCWLAQHENYLVYVKGTKLHFEPKPSGKANPYALIWTPPNADSGAPQFTGAGLRMTRNLTVAKDVVVTVRSWGAKGKTVIAATYPTSKHKGTAAGTSGTNQAEGHVFNIPGLTYDQAIQAAREKHAAITAHEMKIEVTLPADNLLQITTPIELRGTGTAFDQTYYPEAINRHMVFGSVFAMTVHAKNRSPENEVTL
jgi:phage protein D